MNNRHTNNLLSVPTFYKSNSWTVITDTSISGTYVTPRYMPQLATLHRPTQAQCHAAPVPRYASVGTLNLNPPIDPYVPYITG